MKPNSDPSSLAASLRKDASSKLRASIGVTLGVALLVIAINFGSAFLDIPGLKFSELGNVIVVGSDGGGIPFYPMLALSTVVTSGIIFGVTFWMYRRAAKRAQRVLPFLEQGTPEPAVVSKKQSVTFQRSGMQFTRLTLTVTATSGRAFEAMVEVAVGTPLPQARVEDEATVFVRDQGYVVAVNGELFEHPSAS